MKSICVQQRANELNELGRLQLFIQADSNAWLRKWLWMVLFFQFWKCQVPHFIVDSLLKGMGKKEINIYCGLCYVLGFVYFYLIKLKTTHLYLMKKLSLREMKWFAQSYIARSHCFKPELEYWTLWMHSSLIISPPSLSTTKLTVIYLEVASSVRAT